MLGGSKLCLTDWMFELVAKFTQRHRLCWVPYDHDDDDDDDNFSREHHRS